MHREPRRAYEREALVRQWRRTRRGENRAVLEEIDQNRVEARLNELGRWTNVKKITGRDIERILQLALSLTDDPGLESGLAAWRGRGLNTPTALKSTLRRRLRAPLIEAYIRQIDVHVRAGCKVRQAAEIVAANFGVDGQSFDTVVDDLRRAYYRRPRATFVGVSSLTVDAQVRRPVSGLDR
jgi:hypothetical protein